MGAARREEGLALLRAAAGYRLLLLLLAVRTGSMRDARAHHRCAPSRLPPARRPRPPTLHSRPLPFRWRRTWCSPTTTHRRLSCTTRHPQQVPAPPPAYPGALPHAHIIVHIRAPRVCTVAGQLFARACAQHALTQPCPGAATRRCGLLRLLASTYDRWDAVHLAGIASDGYVFEHNHAFYPGTESP